MVPPDTDYWKAILVGSLAVAPALITYNTPPADNFSIYPLLELIIM